MKKTKSKAAPEAAPAAATKTAPRAKSASAPAPAPKVVAKPAPKPVAKPAAKPTSIGRKKPAAANHVAKATAPAVKPGAAVPVVTVITARIDIGFGNALYLRGEGPGLSWDRGVVLECADDDCWTITLPESARPIIYKFLINDLTWSAGEDHIAHPGTTATHLPTF